MITNCYSPPASTLKLHNTEVSASKHLMLWDFNSHSVSWGYKNNDQRGDIWKLDDSEPANADKLTRSWVSLVLKSAEEEKHARASHSYGRHPLVHNKNSQLAVSYHTPVTLAITSAEFQQPCSTGLNWNFIKADWTLFQQEIVQETLNIQQSNDKLQCGKLSQWQYYKAAKKLIPMRQKEKP